MSRTSACAGKWAAVALVLALPALSGCKDRLVEEGTSEVHTIKAKSTVAPEGQRRAFAKQSSSAETGRVQINGFLWRAALDTISFMPIASADAYGGAIVTDWYAPPETPNERFKVNVLVQGEALRSDGVKVTVFRQSRDANGAWSDAQVSATTAIDLENVILARAKDLRQQSTAR